MKENLKKYFKFPTLSVRTLEFNKIMEENPRNLGFTVVDKNSLVGIEVECENLANFPSGCLSGFWTVTEDGSLRNNGKEFITPPIRGNQIEYALQELFSKLPSNRDFSPRTSVHVHLNVRTLTSNEVSSIMFLAILFEKAFFKFVGEDRDKNIHCVPLRGTTIAEDFPRYFPGNIKHLRWLKYSAMNFVPVPRQGTLEFRHMHGTDDIKKLMTWINMILALKKCAYTYSPEVLRTRIFNLNSNSEYVLFAQDVFGKYVDALDVHTREFHVGMEEGVSLLKHYSMSKEFEETITVPSEDSLVRKFYSLGQAENSSDPWSGSPSNSSWVATAVNTLNQTNSTTF